MLVKIYKLLINELSNAIEENIAQGSGDDDNDDDDDNNEVRLLLLDYAD